MKNILVYILLLMVVLIPLPSVLFYLESQKLLDHSLAVTLLVVEVPVGLSFIAIEGWLHKSENKVTTTQRVITETSFDKQKDREEYVNHLRTDILGIIEEKIKNEVNYAEIIRSVEKNKRMILQHLYTYEKGGITQPIYTRYKQIHKIDNKIARSGLPISQMFEQLNLDIIDFSNKDKFGKITSSEQLDKMYESLVQLDYDKLPFYIGFPEKVDFLSDSFNLDMVRPIPESQINDIDFQIREGKSSRDFYIKFNDHVIAECHSKKYADKVLEILLQHYSTIVKFVITLKEERTNQDINKRAFNSMFTHIRESIKQGKPDIGVCNACIGFFPYEKKIEYQKLLEDFNSRPINWAEEIWE